MLGAPTSTTMGTNLAALKASRVLKNCSVNILIVHVIDWRLAEEAQTTKGQIRPENAHEHHIEIVMLRVHPNLLEQQIVDLMLSIPMPLIVHYLASNRPDLFHRCLPITDPALLNHSPDEIIRILNCRLHKELMSNVWTLAIPKSMSSPLTNKCLALVRSYKQNGVYTPLLMSLFDEFFMLLQEQVHIAGIPIHAIVLAMTLSSNALPSPSQPGSSYTSLLEKAPEMVDAINKLRNLALRK